MSERIATWWIRWEDLNWPNYDNLDKIKAHAEALAKADVSTVILFGAHFRWDWMPFFPILHDYIATVAEHLHKYGIKIYDHHSVNLVHRYSTREEMRHVIMDSGPHLPFSPTWEAAASWQYKGKYLNDWRMMDVRTGKPLYLPQYTAEGFCPRNPEFKEAYQDYAKNLIAETGIDGLSADDAMYYMQYNACSCEHCRAELRRRSGIDLPPVEDRSFWMNWDNPAWRDWVDLRFDSSGEFYRDLGKVLPEGFVLTGCGGSSATGGAVANATDARHFLRGCNYVNMEMSGNTPPYKHDPHTVNVPIRNRLANASHHQAAARERGVRAFSSGYTHSVNGANHVWAVSKMLGADAWVSTLKARLGLPGQILETIPNEQDIVGQAFGFEKNHPELFEGDTLGQLAVLFSYETRNHTMFGAVGKGYFKDYQDTLSGLFREGLSPNTVFEIPRDASRYPLLVLSSVAKMTEKERDDLDAYLKAGGKVIVTGPTELPGCTNSWKLPAKVDVPTEKLFSDVPEGGAWIRPAAWIGGTVIAPSGDANVWSEPIPGLYYNPCRVADGENLTELIDLCRKYGKPLPVNLVSAQGYLCTMQETEEQITVQFLAEDYDVDINHELDSIRFHRSRVNLLTKIEPIGIDRTLCLRAETAPEVYTPFNEETPDVKFENGLITVTLPEKCSYAIMRFKK